MRQREFLTLNLDDLNIKRQFMAHIGRLSGVWEFSLRPHKKRRSLNQNAYWHAAFVTPWLNWIREQYGDPSITHDQAHVALKEAVLGREKRRINGRDIYIVPESHTKDTWEFAELTEKAAAFLAEFAGIVVLTPEQYFDLKGQEYAENHKSS